MRKEAGFEVMDKIRVYAMGNEKIEKICQDHGKEMKSEVLANEITLGLAKGYVKEWNINGETVTLGVEKL